MKNIFRISKIKKTAILFFAAGLIGSSFADEIIKTYELNPNPKDLNDLEHKYAYLWEIGNFDLAPNETITGAELTFTNIRDWTSETDRLFVNLVDWSAAQHGTFGTLTTTGGNVYEVVDDATQWKNSDGAPSMKDYFLGWGEDIYRRYETIDGKTRGYTWTDNRSQYDWDLSFVFNQGELTALQSYASDGWFALTFDPDCHYYNDGVALKITTKTTSVPEPSSLALLCLGLMLLLVFAKARSFVRR